MTASIFIARIYGICCLVVGIGILLNREFYRKVMEDYCKNAALMLFTGFFPLFVGLVIILIHNVWVANWTVIITIFGWIALIKGIWLVVFPKTVPKFMEAYAKNYSLFTVHAIVALIFGAFLTYMGYFAG